MRSIAILGCNIYSQITVAHLSLPRAVLNTVKIFAVYRSIPNEKNKQQKRNVCLFFDPLQYFFLCGISNCPCIDDNLVGPFKKVLAEALKFFSTF